MPFESGEHVCADVHKWLIDISQGGVGSHKLMYPGVVVTVESTPDWKYSVQLDNAPVTIPGPEGEQLDLVEGLSEHDLTAGPCPA